MPKRGRPRNKKNTCHIKYFLHRVFHRGALRGRAFAMNTWNINVLRRSSPEIAADFASFVRARGRHDLRLIRIIEKRASCTRGRVSGLGWGALPVRSCQVVSVAGPPGRRQVVLVRR